MPGPTTSDVHVNRPLTNFSHAYRQERDDFVAGRVFPTMPVSQQSDTYYTYDKEYWFRTEAKKRAPATESAGASYGLSTESYRCDVWAIHFDVPEELRVNQDAAIDVDRDAAELTTDHILLRREKEWVSNFFTTGVWGTDLTGTASSPGATEFIFWDDYTNSDPILDITEEGIAKKKATGRKPNVITAGADTYNTLKNHPDILDRIKYSNSAGNPSRVTPAILAMLFEVDEFLVAMATEETANEGGTESMDFVADGESLLLAYRIPRPSLLRPTAGMTFVWTGLVGSQQGFRTLRMDVPLRKATRVETEAAFDQKLVASDLGTLFSDTKA